ncbi:hypothetical protein Tco_0439542 [Tanacetum coccineum]
MPLTPDLSFTGLDEFVNKPVVEKRKSDEEVSKVVRKSDDSPIIKDWVSDSEERFCKISKNLMIFRKGLRHNRQSQLRHNYVVNFLTKLLEPVTA